MLIIELLFPLSLFLFSPYPDDVLQIVVILLSITEEDVLRSVGQCFAIRSKEDFDSQLKDPGSTQNVQTSVPISILELDASLLPAPQ